MSGHEDLLKAIAWYGWVLTGVFTAVALLVRYPLVASGCAIGGALSMLHFKWLALFLTAVVDPQKRRYSRMTMVVLGAYLIKYLIITGVVYLLFRFGVVEPLGFLAGLSVLFISICCAGLQQSRHLSEPQG